MAATLSKADIISETAAYLLRDDVKKAADCINEKFPFTHPVPQKREYTVKEKMKLFMRDGFIDRYSGDKLVNPGMLRAISVLLPEEFPYHAHWKVSDCHLAFWYLMPSLDHIVPVALGGSEDSKDMSNWATTAGFRNQAKGLASLEDMGWTFHDAGKIEDWDGMSRQFLEIVGKHEELLDDKMIKEWSNATKKVFKSA